MNAEASTTEKAPFVSGSLARHVLVMASTGAVGMTAAERLAPVELRQPLVQQAGHSQVQDRVSQELQPFVVVGRETAVGDGPLQERGIGKNMLQADLQRRETGMH